MNSTLMRPALCAILLLAPLGAKAAAPAATFCRPASAVAAKANDCEENGVFAKQAKECREALAKFVGESSSALAKVIGKGGQDSQSANFSSTAKDYGLSAAELDRLIGFASLAAIDLDRYLDWVVLPEDVDNPEIAGNDMQKYADGISCFGDNVRAVKSEISAVTEMKKQLEAARAAATAFGATATGRGEAIKAGPVAPALDAGTGKKSSVPLPAYSGEDKVRHSDISGTKEEKKKP